MPTIATRSVFDRPTRNAFQYGSAESKANTLSPMSKPAGCVRKPKPLWMPRTRMFSSVLCARNQTAAAISRHRDHLVDQAANVARLRQDQSRLLGSARRGAAGRGQRIGGAYWRPPLFHRLLTPRGSFSADFGPTLRSKISP